MDYVQLEDLAQYRTNWHQWKVKPAHIRAEYNRQREITMYDLDHSAKYL